MFITRIVRPRVLAPLALMGILGAAGFGFAGANTLPADVKAGSKSAAIAGYTVTNLKYVLSETTPANITSVTFTLSADASQAKVALQKATGSTLYGCTKDLLITLDWSCTISGPAVSAENADELTIVATQ